MTSTTEHKRRFVISSTPARKERATLKTVADLERMGASSDTIEFAKNAIRKRP